MGDDSWTKHFRLSSITTLDRRCRNCATLRDVTHLSQDLLRCGTRLKVCTLLAPGPRPIPATSCRPPGCPAGLSSYNCVHRALPSATVSPLPIRSLRSWCHQGCTAQFANSQGKFRRYLLGEGSHFSAPPPLLPNLTLSYLAKSCLILPCHILPNLAKSCRILPCHIFPNLAKSYLVISCLILPNLTLSYLAKSCLILLNLTSSYLAKSCQILPCHISLNLA